MENENIRCFVPLSLRTHSPTVFILNNTARTSANTRTHTHSIIPTLPISVFQASNVGAKEKKLWWRSNSAPLSLQSISIHVLCVQNSFSVCSTVRALRLSVYKHSSVSYFFGYISIQVFRLKHSKGRRKLIDRCQTSCKNSLFQCVSCESNFYKKKNKKNNFYE